MITRIVITCDTHEDPIAAFDRAGDPGEYEWRFDQHAMASHGRTGHRGGIAEYYEPIPPERQRRVSRLVTHADGTTWVLLTCSRCNNPVEVMLSEARAACRAIAATGSDELPGIIENVPRRVFLSILKQVRPMR
jgi:hypothetical protein